MEEQLKGQIKFDPVPPLEFIYENISVEAEVQQQILDGNGEYQKIARMKNILKQSSGKFQPNTVTAILGPSGSGKTTMLNLLSGRLLSKNLTLKGRIKINGKAVDSMIDYKGVIGYVMQQDLMLPTFTPQETFKFITDMRLPFKTEEEKIALVDSMIESLGLRKCADTYIGNSLIRGLSGGQRKRTSVGVELLINPSLIFLDEPTTGLDSTTALNLVRFLNRLAESGRTVVTTIHQPSSQIFLEFNKILLMVDGNVVYHNNARDSMTYFSSLGLGVPVHSNPMDHYMKLMNKQGITLQYMQEEREITEQQVDRLFQERIELLILNYKSQEKPHDVTVTVSLQDHGDMASWCTQFQLIFKRSIINQLRNPLGIRVKLFQMIFFGIISIILFERQANTLDSYIQNTGGSVYFICMNVGFVGIFGSINIFSQQRPVFVRQRLSNTYLTSSYYVGRSLAYLPIQLLLPLVYLSICYFVIHLENTGSSFAIVIGSAWLATWMSSAYGLLLSTVFFDSQVAMSLVPILIIPLMLVGGFYAPLSSVPDFFRIFQYISMFKYMFQTFIYAQFYDKVDGFTIQLRQKQFKYKGNIMGENNPFYFQEPFWLSMFLMGIIGLAIRVLSLIALNVISNPPKINLLDPSSQDATKNVSLLNKKVNQIQLHPVHSESIKLGQQSSIIAFKK